MRHAPIESAELRSVAGADGEVKGVTRAKIELRLSGVAGRGAKILARDGKNLKAFRGKAGERRKRRGAMIRAETAGARFERQGRSKLGHGPIADRQLGRLLFGKPGLRSIRIRLSGQGADEHGGVHVKHQYRNSSRTDRSQFRAGSGCMGIGAVKARKASRLIGLS